MSLVAMGNLLRKQGKKKFNPGTAVNCRHLIAKDSTTIKLVKTVMAIRLVANRAKREKRFTYNARNG
jgi:hypothetical protein